MGADIAGILVWFDLRCDGSPVLWYYPECGEPTKVTILDLYNCDREWNMFGRRMEYSSWNIAQNLEGTKLRPGFRIGRKSNVNKQ